MKLDLLRQRITEHYYDERLNSIYLDESLLEYERNRYLTAIDQFEKLYGINDVTVFSVPGRSEVGGNHTDHQHGKVLACSLNLDIIAIVTPTKGNIININSDGRKINGIRIDDLSYNENEKHSSRALVKGVLKKMEDEYYRIGGFNAYFTSDVLVGSGMSSSAAFEVMIGTIISGLYNRFEIDPVEIAKYAQYSENEYFGKPCGLMDQMACSLGNLITIDFENVNAPKVRKVNVDFSQNGYSLCIIDAKGSHSSLTDEYASIPNEMKKVAQFFGKDYLREVSYEDILNHINEIRAIAGDRAVLRSLHVLLENKRVEQEVEALENNHFDKFLDLVKQSGDSSYKYLQNIYANSDYQNQSLSIALMLSENILQNNGVCRVHGGGFAGTIQAFVKNDFVLTYKKEIEKVFGENSCKVLKVRPTGGMIVAC